MQLKDVERNYDRAARYYDWLTDIVFGRILGLERYRGRTIDLLGDLDGVTVLDVGCGTGRNFAHLVPRVGTHGHVVGLDFSEGMLERARRRVERMGWQNVTLVQGDAVTLEGAPKPCGAVTSAWCYGIVYDLDAALHRALDVLRPGGRIAIMDFERARPERGPLRALYPIYRKWLQWAGIDTAGDLDDARLQGRWSGGRDVLRARLSDLHEERYLSGAGMIIAGTLPEEESRP
jgi:ubiquinone/menaquinone biosynthesis C-methylase UbiE